MADAAVAGRRRGHRRGEVGGAGPGQGRRGRGAYGKATSHWERVTRGTSWAPAVWGQEDLQSFNGDLSRIGMHYGGGLNAAHVGLDLYANERMLAGLSVMRSWGRMEYADDGVDGAVGEWPDHGAFLPVLAAARPEGGSYPQPNAPRVYPILSPLHPSTARGRIAQAEPFILADAQRLWDSGRFQSRPRCAAGRIADHV